MNWLSDLSDKLITQFPSLPKSMGLLITSVIGLSVAIYLAALFGCMAYDQIHSRLPVTESDVQYTKNKLEVSKIKNTIRSVDNDMDWVDPDIKLDKARTENDIARAKAGLPTGPTVNGMEGFSAALDTITKNLSSILAIMFAARLLPTFSSTGEPWRLALNISAAVILSGAYSLVHGITADTTVQIRWAEWFLTVNSGSVGVILMCVGVFLSGFSIFMLTQKA
jgi:hypothetical protein